MNWGDWLFLFAVFAMFVYLGWAPTYVHFTKKLRNVRFALEDERDRYGVERYRRGYEAGMHEARVRNNHYRGGYFTFGQTWGGQSPKSKHFVKR